MKIVRQHDTSDCGPACLAMVAQCYGISLPLSKFREITKTDNNGTTIYGIHEGATKLGMCSKPLFGDWDNLKTEISNKNIIFPFIAHFASPGEFEHFVVVFSIANCKCKLDSCTVEIS